MESIDGVPSALGQNLEAVQRALEGAGVIFLEPDNGGPGVRLRRR
jgi:hypothetical protein